MLRRRLKFLAWLVALLAIVLGGSYLFAPQWLMRAGHLREAMAAKLETHSVQVGDTRWSYYEGGEGPTIVLLHGFAGDKDVWLPVAALLSAQGNYDVDAQAARLDAFVQALRLPRFMLAGHGTGAAIAAAYAADHPEHVAGLALLDAFGLKAGENDFARQARSGHNPYLFDDRAGHARLAALEFAQPPDRPGPGRFVDVLVERNRRDRDFIQRTFQAWHAQPLALQQRLGRLTMPVLGLWCHDDRITDISALDSLRNGLTAASAISTSTINGCGHLPMLEKPETTAQILTGFALSH
ncbi:MAG: alpha/beta hydrolase [Rhodanobacter sp. SCN 67-45]|nr:MAG: alpha/beta hydrolase [Rhodanobacter sp. SCN 67-45]